MNIKPLHLAIIGAGFGLVFLLALLPKFVVSDKEKRIKESEKAVRQELSKDDGTHDSEAFDSVKASNIRKLLAVADSRSTFRLVDSLGLLYKNAFMLDSSMSLYQNYAELDKKYYIMSVRDGLTGFQMTQVDEKKKYYQSLCEKVIADGLKKHPDFLDLQVEELRLRVLLSAYNHQPPIQWVGKLKDLVAQNPSLVSGQIALAEFYQQAGKTDEAIERYTQVLENEKDNLQAHIELVNLYFAVGKNISAKEHLMHLQDLNKVTKDSFIEDFVKKSLEKLKK